METFEFDVALFVDFLLLLFVLLASCSKKSMPQLILMSFLPTFSPRNFMESGLIIKFLIHFKLICVNGMR